MLGIIGSVGFGVSLIIHVLTVLNIDVSSRVPYIWIIHPAVLLYSACAVLLLLRAGYPTRRLTLGILEDNLPRWVMLTDGLLFAYMFLNGAICLFFTKGGNADLVNGQYLLMGHARVIAHLSEREFHLQKAFELRMFSGAWLCFWAWSSSYFLFWKHVPVHHRPL